MVKGAVCKTVIHRFESDSSLNNLRLQLLAIGTGVFTLSIVKNCRQPFLNPCEYSTHLLKLWFVPCRFQHFHSFSNKIEVFSCQGQLSNRVVLISVPVVLLIIYLNGRIVSELVRTHDLYIVLNSSQRDAFADTFHVVQRFRNFINQVLYRPSSVSVA